MVAMAWTRKAEGVYVTVNPLMPDLLALLDHLVKRVEGFVPDVSDAFKGVPRGMSRGFIGAAVADLARQGMIRKAPKSPRYTTQNRRHGGYLEVWTLNGDRTTVESWKRSHHLLPEPGWARHVKMPAGYTPDPTGISFNRDNKQDTSMEERTPICITQPEELINVNR
jgi:hypothetical protein